MLPIWQAYEFRDLLGDGENVTLQAERERSGIPLHGAYPWSIPKPPPKLKKKSFINCW